MGETTPELTELIAERFEVARIHLEKTCILMFGGLTKVFYRLDGKEHHFYVFLPDDKEMGNSTSDALACAAMARAAEGEGAKVISGRIDCVVHSAIDTNITGRFPSRKS
jgi:hypothetical protein